MIDEASTKLKDGVHYIFILSSFYRRLTDLYYYGLHLSVALLIAWGQRYLDGAIEGEKNKMKIYKFNTFH